MADPMTAEEFKAANAAIERAHTEIGEVCVQGVLKRFRMSIPAQPDRDTDLIVSEGLSAGEKLAAEVERLRAELAQAEVDSGEFVNELLDGSPACCWDDDMAAEAIAVKYVRWLEREVERLGGSLHVGESCG